MSSPAPDARFFGVDLTAFWREVRRPWLRMHQWPMLAWLTPSPPVRLLHADGRESYWFGDTRPGEAASARPARFTALALPEDFVLRPKLAVPVMGEADTAKALGLQMRSISPFPAPEMVWGYRRHVAPDGAQQIDVALVSRKQIEAYLLSQSARLQGMGPPEVWALADGRPPIVLGGYGESRRAASARQLRNVGYGLLLSALLLVAAIALTPTLQLWRRATEAVEVYGATVQRTKALVRQREILLQSVEKLGALSEILAGRIEPLRVLEKLTQTLPDDTSVQTLSLKGATVTITGLTANAATLMQLLGEQRGLRDVRAPSAATRVGGASREAFVIVFALDPRSFGVVGGSDALTLGGSASAASAASAPSSPSAAGSPAQPAVSAAVAGTLPPAAPAAPAAPAVLAAPSAPAAPNARPAPRAGGSAGSGSAPTFGGGATPTFGGGATRPFVAPSAAPAASAAPPDRKPTP